MSLKRGPLRAFLSSPLGVASLVGISGLILVAVFAPSFWGDRSTALDVMNRSQGGSWAHPFGTDRLGRDIFARVLVGTRLSIGLAVSAALVGAVLGGILGTSTAVLPRRTRSVLLRVIDTCQAFPTILVGIFVAAILGAGARSAIIGVGVGTAFPFARVASTLAMSVSGRDYMDAAKVLGLGRFSIVRRHALPNMSETLFITSTVSMSRSIVTVSALSFLGLGIQPPKFDWGRMLTEGVDDFYTQPLGVLGPGAFIAVAALTFGYLGEALARAMNPRLWTSAERGRRRPRMDVAPTEKTLTVGEPAQATSAIASNSQHPQKSSDQDVLAVRNLSIRFPIGNQMVSVVTDVSFTVAPGERVGLVGESGSGKSLTSSGIADLLPHTAQTDGEVELNGRVLSELSRKDADRLLADELAIVFQDPSSSLNPALKIGTQLTEATVAHGRGSRAQARDLALAALREVGIPSPQRVMESYPHELSGGMRQRVVISLGLIHEPSLLIADEPTTALDVTIQAQVMSVLQRINREHHVAILLISHDLGLIAQNCDRAIVMYGGRIVEDAPIDRILAEPVHPYTRALLRAIPDLSRPRHDRLDDIPGRPPSPGEFPGGCAFNPRCPHATDVCRDTQPPLEHRIDRRVACWHAGVVNV